MDRLGIASFGNGILFGMGTSGALATGVGVAYLDPVSLNSPAGGSPALKSYVLPANALLVQSRGIRICGWGTVANNANVKTVLVKFGATTLVTITPTASTANGWYIDAKVFVNGAVAVQSAVGLAFNAPGTPTSAITVSTPAETITGAITVAFSGTQTSAADIVQSGMLIEYLQ